MKVEVTEEVVLTYDEMRRIVHRALELPTQDKIDNMHKLADTTTVNEPWFVVMVKRPVETKVLK